MLSSDLILMTKKYLDGQIELGQLEEWLVPLVPLYASDPTSDDADLVATIELGLAEISDGISTQSELCDSLRAMLIKQPIKFNWDLGNPEPVSIRVTSGSSNQTQFDQNHLTETSTGPIPAIPTNTYATTFVGSEVESPQLVVGT